MMISFDDDFFKPFCFPPFFERIYLLDLSSCLNNVRVDESDLLP